MYDVKFGLFLPADDIDAAIEAAEIELGGIVSESKER